MKRGEGNMFYGTSGISGIVWLILILIILCALFGCGITAGGVQSSCGCGCGGGSRRFSDDCDC